MWAGLAGEFLGIQADDLRSSLFSRLTRYPPNPSKSPRENSLTESFGAVLERVEGLSALLAGRWGLASGGGDRWRVETQVPTGRGLDLIDLELEADDALVWVEIKHGAELGLRQLARYRQALENRAGPRERKLILLTPENFHVESADVENADVQTWQALGTFLRNEAGSPAGEDVLLDEFIKFLEEEGLVTEAFSRAYLEAVQNRKRATESFQDLLRRTHERVECRQGRATRTWPGDWPRGVSKDWPDFFAVWKAHDWGESARFEWNLGTEVEQRLCFGAGLTVDAEHAKRSALADDHWVEAVCGDVADFAGPKPVGTSQYPVWRFFRRKDPEALVESSLSVEQQVEHLSTWVLETFEALRRHRWHT